MKIEYRPCHLDAGNSAGYVMSPLICGTVVDYISSTNTGAPLSNFRNSLDTKTYDPTKPFTRFYRVWKYARMKHVNTRRTDDAVTGGNGGYNSLPNCMTMLWLPATGLGNGT